VVFAEPGGDEEVGSANLIPRSFDRRLELMVPLKERTLAHRVPYEILDRRTATTRWSEPSAHTSSSQQSDSSYAGLTFSARGPFGSWPTANVTFPPSRMESKGVLVHADCWKKYSVPSGVAMKPTWCLLRWMIGIRSA